MFVKIHSSKDYGNTGSCRSVIEYLEKENQDKELSEVKHFFSNESNQISSFDAMNRLDNNCAKLGREDARFYMISINPSQKEMKHMAYQISGRRISDISQFTHTELKRFENTLNEYSRNVMDIYAHNFAGNLSKEDILYFGKIEHERKYTRISEEVKTGLKNKGDLKEGFQSHVHVIVSRKDITNTKKLSPFTNHRNSKNTLNGKQVPIGFNRKEFVEKCEKEFDRAFSYDRSLDNSFNHYYTMKNIASQLGRNYGRSIIKHVIPGSNVLLKTHDIIKGFDHKDPLKNLTTFFSQNKDAAKMMKSILIASSPQKALLEVAKKLPSIIEKATTLKI